MNTGSSDEIKSEKAPFKSDYRLKQALSIQNFKKAVIPDPVTIKKEQMLVSKLASMPDVTAVHKPSLACNG